MAKENEVVKELDDVEQEKDFFEKLLEEEINPEGDDAAERERESDSKTEKENPESGKSSPKEEESVEALKARIADLEKERKGQLDSVVKSRQERSLFKSELNQLKDAVSSLLAQRENALGKEENTEDEAPLIDPKAKVEFDDDGDSAYVDLTKVKDAIAKENALTRKELDELKQERAAEAAKQAYMENVGSVLKEDEVVFTEAYHNLGKIYEDLNNKIIELQERTGEAGEDGTLPQDTALELFAGSPEEKEFQKEHPGIDPTRVARAFNTKVDLRVSLRHIADTLNLGAQQQEEVVDKKLEQAKNKPGGLGSHGNRKAEDSGDLIARISSLSADDLENLSDAEVAKIEAMLLREEMNSN